MHPWKGIEGGKKRIGGLKAELEVAPRVSHLLYHPSLILFLIYLKGDLRKVEELEQQWSNR